MARLMLASITGAIGYLLLYAGIADRGRFALRPWDALAQASNAPAGTSSGSSSSSSGGGGGILSKIGDVVSNLVPAVP